MDGTQAALAASCLLASPELDLGFIVVMLLLTLCGGAPADSEVEEREHLVQFVCSQMFSAGVNV